MGKFRKILDDIDKIKMNYESKISILILNELEEFRKEFGELPNGISVYSSRINQLSTRPPYALDITTKIDIGI